MYNLFKFLHVLGAIVWIGGLLTITVINARMARTQNRAAMEALSQQTAFFGRSVLGAASGLTLVAGVIAAIILRVSSRDLWITWGVIGILASGVIGSVFIRRTMEELGRTASSSSPDGSKIAALQKRMLNLNLVNLLILLSVVAAMVFKPTL